MAKIIKPLGTKGPPHARMLVAEFDGFVRDGATLKLSGSVQEIHSGDLIAFSSAGGLSAGISVDEDADGLHSLVGFGPSIRLRIGLENLGDGVYAFRPAPQHLQLWPQLGPGGEGEKIS